MKNSKQLDFFSCYTIMIREHEYIIQYVKEKLIQSFTNEEVISKLNFGDFICNFYNMDINEVVEIINTPIKNIESYYSQCITNLSSKYNPLLSIIIMRSLHISLVEEGAKWDNSDNDIILIEEIYNNYFKSLSALKVILERDFASILYPEDLEKLCSIQDIRIKYYADRGFLSTIYFINDIYSLIAFDLVNCHNSGIELKKCKNCGKCFIPSSRSDEIYCDNIFKDGRTCKQVGYENKIKNDKFLKEYRREYKRRHGKIAFSSDIVNYKENYFIPWNKEAIAKREYYRCINDYNGFLKWIEENKNNYMPK